MENKIIFENIYKNKIWNNGNDSIPLSGPGSSLENTKECSKLLNDFIYNNNCKNVLDLGCGDLTWISNTDFFNENGINYTGIDIVESVINENKLKFPQKTFYCKDIIKEPDFNETDTNFAKQDIVIIRDVIFHLKNEEILSIFNNIKNKFKYIMITSCKNVINTDSFNRWHFVEKNINIYPFNVSFNHLFKINENVFNRYVYIYNHESFYNF